MEDQKPEIIEECASARVSDLTRRDFLRYTGYGAATLTLLSQLDALRPAIAAPLTTAASYL